MPDCDHSADLRSIAESLKNLLSLHKLTVFALVALAGAQQVLPHLWR